MVHQTSESMATIRDSSKLLSSERRRQQAASAAGSFSPSRQQAGDRNSKLGLLRWLPFGSSYVSSLSTSPASSRKAAKAGNNARQLGSGTYTSLKVFRRPCGLLAKLCGLEISFSTVFKLCLLGLILTGVTCILLVRLDSEESLKKYSLALSGPGLSPDFALPLRYLYITLTPVHNERSSSGSDNSSSVNRFIRLWSELWRRQQASHSVLEKTLGGLAADDFSMQLDPAKWKVTWTLKPLPPHSLLGKRLAFSTIVDRGNHEYILRFRLLQNVPRGYTLEARISHSGELDSTIGNKKGSQLSALQLEIMPQTFTLEGPVYVPSSCPCPLQGSPARWLQAMQCPDMFTQLTEDLFPFRIVDLHSIREESRKLVGPQSLRSLIHYVVKGNQLYRRSLGPLPGFQYFSDAIFSYLTSVVGLPDVEFLFNLGDWPVERRVPSEGGLPIFGWSGGTDYADIVLPQWEVLKGIFVLGQSSGKDEDLLTAQEHTSRPLKDRIPKALFRGRDSNPIRIEVARLAKKYPSLLDVQITSWEKEENAAAEKELGGGSRIPLQKFGDYKYQLLLDGTVAAYRTPYLFHSGSVPVKHESEYYEWFYMDLLPMEHYIPFQADLSDLIKQLQWAEAHPKETAAIAKNAQNYAREYLTPDKVVCYYYRALSAYALRQNTPPKVEDDMVKVEHGPKAAGCSCASASGRQNLALESENDYPIVPVYPDSAREILGRPNKGVVLVAFSSFCNHSALYMPKFLKLARLYRAKEAPLVFAAADGYKYTFPFPYRFCNFPGAQPKVMFLKSPRREHGESQSSNDVDTEKIVPEYMREPLTLFDTANFVNRHLSQQYHVEVEKDPLDEMSQPLPMDNGNKLIKTVVGANFDDLVLNNTKDVLLFVHAPWSGLCKRFKRVYEGFAEETRTSPIVDKLLFTSMNGSENRLRYREFSWSTYPVLWYVSGSVPPQRMRPIQFAGPWNLAGLKHFVQTQIKATEES